MPESVMIDIWTVPSGRQEEMTEGLRAAFEQFRLIDGFIGAGVLANYDGTKVASYVRMRSAADLQSALRMTRSVSACVPSRQSAAPTPMLTNAPA